MSSLDLSFAVPGNEEEESNNIHNNNNNIYNGSSSSSLKSEGFSPRRQRRQRRDHNFRLQTTHVYIRDTEHGWIPAQVLAVPGSGSNNESFSSLSSSAPAQGVWVEPNPPSRPIIQAVDHYTTEENGILPPPPTSATSTKPPPRRTIFKLDKDKATNSNSNSIKPPPRPVGMGENAIWVSLQEYPPSNAVPLQNISSDSVLATFDDMCDIPMLHEPAILYNLKERYEGPQGVPYTRTGDILIAINPYRWIKGLYSEEIRQLYAEQHVWTGTKLQLSNRNDASTQRIYALFCSNE
eukprot:scaffold30753_cov57-Attheya_sp.AAC.3